MTWLRGRPEGRVWALVMDDTNAHPIPFVGQYEPRTDCWVDQGSRVHYMHQAKTCSYSPLPYHERFLEKTHLFYPEPHAMMECPMCTDPVWQLQPTMFEEGKVAECRCGTKVKVHADGEDAYLEDITGDERSEGSDGRKEN